MIDHVLYACAAILLIIWGIGFFMLHAGIAIHILPFISLIAIVLSILEVKHEPSN